MYNQYFLACTDYTSLDEEERNSDSHSGSQRYCDSNDIHHGTQRPKFEGPGWYRFEGAAGDKIAENPIEGQMCGTGGTGWMSGLHPVQSGHSVERTVCFNANQQTCWVKKKIKVQNCGEYYIYLLPNAKCCNCGYCAVNSGMNF